MKITIEISDEGYKMFEDMLIEAKNTGRVKDGTTIIELITWYMSTFLPRTYKELMFAVKLGLPIDGTKVSKQSLDDLKEKLGDE